MSVANHWSELGKKAGRAVVGAAPAPLRAEFQKQCYLRAKRLMDFLAAAVLLLLLAPALLLICLMIKLDSPGPVIFAQWRMGWDRRSGVPRPFVVYKFRSMVDHSDQSIHQSHVRSCIRDGGSNDANGGNGQLVKLAHDGRVTRVGHWLRRSSLDELPQLWNVLRGEMSLVGPRPVPLYEVVEYKPWHRQRLAATPGMTGWWQVCGRGRSTLDEMVRMDIEYIDHQSLGLDLKILVLTIPAVIRGRGAG